MSHTALFDDPLVGMRFLRDMPRFAVYEGRWGVDGPCCVAKVGHDPAQRAVIGARFRDEARVLRLLESVPGVPKVLRLDSAAAMLVNTRAAGERLTDLPPAWLRELPNTLRWGIALASVLGDVHAAHVFHGDLRPEHVFVDRETERVTPVNFGDAVAQSHIDLDFMHPAMLGRTLSFSAPEQTGRMGRAVDYRADLYSLGALLYWALTGRPPVVEDEPLAALHALLTRAPVAPGALNPAVPPALSAILLRLLAKNPQQRYQSAHGVQFDLRHALAAVDGRGDGAAFVIGAADHRIQPAQPSRLFGREDDLACLASALDARAGRRGVVLVHGYSGAGKTSLVRGLYPLLSERGGIFAGGRYDEYQRLTPYGGLAQALSDLAEYWLAEPSGELERLRSQLHEALGSNAVALARLAPAFARVLWPVQALSSDSDPPLANMQRRLQRTLAALFDVIRARGVPVVLFIDNLQWADAGSLDLFESAALDAQRTLLLVGAYRSNEVDAAHPLAAVLARIRAAGVELFEVLTGNLGAQATHAVVTDVLAGTPSEQHTALAPLAHALHRRTEGNPFFVLQYLRRLCDTGQLRNVAGRWQWDDAALDALPGSDNLVSGLVQEMQRLPEQVRHLAGGCACLGGAIDAELLAAAIHETTERVDAWLLPLLQRDMLLATGPTDVVDHDGVTVQARGGARRLRFCHDRMQQAAYALLGTSDRERWHLDIARALRDGPSQPGGAATRRFTMASHFERALTQIQAPVEVEQVFELLLASAVDAAASASFDTALRFAHGAESLCLRVPQGAARQLGVALLKHRALCSLSRHEESDAAFSVVLQLARGNSLAIAGAVRDQASALALRLRWREACELALQHLVVLGIEVPADDRWDEALDTEVDALYVALDRRGADVFERLAPLRDARVGAASMLLAGITITAVRWQPVVSRWAVQRSLRIGLEHGHSAALPTQLAAIGMVLDPLRGDRATGFALAQSARPLQALYPDPAVMARFRIMGAVISQYWFEPLEQVLTVLRDEERTMEEVGDAENLIQCRLAALTLVLECGARLDSSLAEADAALAISARLRDRFGPTALVAQRQFARCLAGLTLAPGSFDERGASEQEVLASFDGNPRARGRFCTYRALGAALFGDWPGALQYSSDALAAFGKYLLGYHDLLLLWVHAAALAQARRVAPAAQRA
ncbi:MAG TPA: AAA family ATPase, partial [Burkholderiaceae bacterium]